MNTTASNNSAPVFGKTSTTNNQLLDIDNFSFTDIMSAASQFTDNAFTFSESSTYTVACSTPKKRKMSARYEDEMVNQDGDNEEQQLTVTTSCKKVKMETYTAATSPTKKKLPIFKLSENKTKDANVDPMNADCSSMSALKGNMLDCFNSINSIASELNDDFFKSSVSSFTSADLQDCLSLLNQNF
ncbi:predicted protein [Naegleria gruberi]|uniref:Predicted protein n=1 Tax=Naegleria gruberi TaxID=5762 RepID=D2VWC7_NAEGR|nr:uncharacterized protein NAEGRDRAFT_81467 [Naegleria gruberi]EFC38811.1 predicted protein [Naegleria gruberi]|eukprot:XP_002671555.1 predicted protein [Naegleria gruberi strain NEG-M]